MIHPATAHFAIVLPVVASIFGLIYLFTRSESMSKISSRVTLFAALAMVAVWYTGSQAGPAVYDYLSSEGKAVLLSHKELGLYLAVAFALIAVVKFLGCQMKKFALEALSIILLIALTGATLYQGKLGGEITYKHGMAFKAPMMLEYLHDTEESVEELEDDSEKVELYEENIDDIKMLSEELDALYGKKPQESEE